MDAQMSCQYEVGNSSKCNAYLDFGSAEARSSFVVDPEVPVYLEVSSREKQLSVVLVFAFLPVLQDTLLPYVVHNLVFGLDVGRLIEGCPVLNFVSRFPFSGLSETA